MDFLENKVTDSRYATLVVWHEYIHMLERVSKLTLRILKTKGARQSTLLSLACDLVLSPWSQLRIQQFSKLLCHYRCLCYKLAPDLGDSQCLNWHQPPIDPQRGPLPHYCVVGVQWVRLKYCHLSEYADVPRYIIL